MVLNRELNVKVLMLALILHPKSVTLEMTLDPGVDVPVMLMILIVWYMCLSTFKISMPQYLQNGNTMIISWMNTRSFIVLVNVYVVPPQSWGDRSDTKHSKCLLLGGRQLNQLTLIPKPKGSGGARAATAQVGPANNRNDTKRCLPVEASLRPGEAVPW